MSQMTLKKLGQLRYLRLLIQKERERIEDLRESLTPRSPDLSGMPKGSGARDKIGETVPAIVDREENIDELLQQLEQEERELTEWIIQAPPKIQLICRLRFIDGYRWDEVADELDNGNGVITDGSVRMAVNNYLKRWNQDHTDDADNLSVMIQGEGR